MTSSDYFDKGISILGEISDGIVEKDNIGAIANLILEHAVNYTDAEKGSLMLINEKGELYILAARGIGPVAARSYRVKIGEGIAGVVAAMRTPVLVADINDEPWVKAEQRDHYKTRSFISCPIVSKSKLFGVININDRKDGSPFTKEEFDILKIITNQAAIFLENAKLMTALKSKALELEELNRKLVEADLVKTEFLTRVSHELRTPLNSIKGAIYYLREAGKLSKTEQEEFYSIVTDEANRLISTVEGQLDFLRDEEGTRAVENSIFYLKDVLQEISEYKLLKTALARKNIRLKIDVQEEMSGVVGDRVRTAQLFTNLIEAMIGYLKKNDSIEITVREEEFIRARVLFSGQFPDTLSPLGLDWKDLVRLDRGSDLIKLYLGQKIAEAQRWGFSVESTEEGFVVSLTIPPLKKVNKEVVVDATMNIFVEFISELLEINTCSVMLSNELSQDLTIRSARGLEEDVVKMTRIKLGDKIAGWVALEGRPLFISDIEKDPRFGKQSMQQYNTRSLLCLPLKVGQKVVGVLNLNNKKAAESFSMRDFYIASAISERMSYCMEKILYGDYGEEEVYNVMSQYESLVSATRELPKKESVFPDLVLKIMEELGAEEVEKKNAVYAFMVYDLRPIVVASSPKGKESSSPDAGTLNIHSSAAIDFMKFLECSESLQKAIAHLYERYDGTGYPAGLKGTEIPLISRVISVVDALYRSMAKKGSKGRAAWDEALQMVQKGSGSYYDPDVVRALLSCSRSMVPHGLLFADEQEPSNQMP